MRGIWWFGGDLWMFLLYEMSWFGSEMFREFIVWYLPDGSFLPFAVEEDWKVWIGCSCAARHNVQLGFLNYTRFYFRYELSLTVSLLWREIVIWRTRSLWFLRSIWILKNLGVISGFCKEFLDWGGMGSWKWVWRFLSSFVTRLRSKNEKWELNKLRKSARWVWSLE